MCLQVRLLRRFAQNDIGYPINYGSSRMSVEKVDFP
jgi:hypothetical protein